MHVALHQQRAAEQSTLMAPVTHTCIHKYPDAQTQEAHLHGLPIGHPAVNGYLWRGLSPCCSAAAGATVGNTTAAGSGRSSSSSSSVAGGAATAGSGGAAGGGAVDGGGGGAVGGGSVGPGLALHGALCSSHL